MNVRTLAVVCLAIAALAPLTHAQTFPARSMRWVVPYPAGGGADFMTRTVGAQMSADLGQSIAVDNKPGGAGAIAAQDVLRSSADGHVLMTADNGQLVFNPALYKQLTYKASDLAPVTLMGRLPLMLVTGSGSEFKDARDFLTKAKAHPGKYSVASAGAGSPHHMALEMLKKKAGLYLVHIPYRGAAPALSDVAGGQVPLAMMDYAASFGFIKGGKLRVLAVANAKRLPQLPDVPTLAELGVPGAEAAALVGLSVPAGTPPDVVTGLQHAATKALLSPAVHKKLVDFGVEPSGMPTAEYAALLKSETTRWHALIRELKITLD